MPNDTPTTTGEEDMEAAITHAKISHMSGLEDIEETSTAETTTARNSVEVAAISIAAEILIVEAASTVASSAEAISTGTYIVVPEVSVLLIPNPVQWSTPAVHWEEVTPV